MTENQNFVVHNFGKSDGDIIFSEKMFISTVGGVKKVWSKIINYSGLELKKCYQKGFFTPDKAWLGL